MSDLEDNTSDEGEPSVELSSSGIDANSPSGSLVSPVVATTPPAPALPPSSPPPSPLPPPPPSLPSSSPAAIARAVIVEEEKKDNAKLVTSLPTMLHLVTKLIPLSKAKRSDQTKALVAFKRETYQWLDAHEMATAVARDDNERKQTVHLSALEKTQSIVIILRNCATARQRLDKADVLLDTYHALIDIHSLTDLFLAAAAADGWAVLLRPGFGFEASTPAITAIRVAVQGNYNKGKTFVLNLLANAGIEVKLREGVTHHTRGISMHLVPKKNETPAMVLFDSAGSNTSVVWNEANVQNKRSTDAFIRELLHRVADVKLIVTGRLTCDDQQYLNELIAKLKDDKRTRPRSELGEHIHGGNGNDRPILVHNFSELVTVEQVEGVIKGEIMGTMKAEEQEASTNERWWRSAEFDHFVLARAGTAAGRHYNHIAIALLQSHLRLRTNYPVHEVLPTIRKQAQQLLQSYLIEDNGNALVHSTIVRNINLTGESRVDERLVKLDGSLTLDEQMQDVGVDGMYRRFVLNATSTSGRRPALMLSPYISIQKYGSVFANDKAFEPRIDVQCAAEGKRVVIKLDIPGGSVKMRRKGQILMFTGERKRDIDASQYNNGQGQGQVLVERLFGKYEYSVTLPPHWEIVTAAERRANGIYTIDLCHPAQKRRSSCYRMLLWSILFVIIALVFALLRKRAFK